jgi:hypothetical protein
MAGEESSPSFRSLHQSWIRATEPATCGEAIEVPEHVEYRPYPSETGDSPHRAPVVARADTMFSPGAATVGTTRPSTAKPRLENEEISSTFPARCPRLEATAMMFLASFGEVILVPLPEPEFPAENTNVKS